MPKRLLQKITLPLVKDSVKWSMAIIGVLSTAMGVVGVSLNDLLPWQPSCLLRLFIFIALFVLLTIVAGFATYRRSRRGVSLLINGMNVDVVVDNIFMTQGVKVIPFDEYYDTEVDDIVISRNSLNGVFIERYADYETLNRVAAESQRSLLDSFVDDKGRTRYALGTIKVYGEYALLAFTHMDEMNRAYLRRGQYEKILLNMWDELDRIYAGRHVVLPLLGSGITRFESGKPAEDDLLRCMLCTLRASKHHFKNGIEIVLTDKTAERIRLFEVKSYTESWSNTLGEKSDL